jgi:hypothetical protein
MGTYKHIGWIVELAFEKRHGSMPEEWIAWQGGSRRTRRRAIRDFAQSWYVTYWIDSALKSYRNERRRGLVRCVKVYRREP